MSNIDLLLDNIAQLVKSNENQQVQFSTLDLRYAYPQIPLDKSTREQCNFSLIGVNSTGTYQIQKAIDLTLTNYANTYAYLDDILIVTNGSVDIHKQKIQTILEIIDVENISISLDKCKFACKQVEWPGYTINSKCTTPLLRKTEAIEKLSPPKTFK